MAKNYYILHEAYKEGSKWAVPFMTSDIATHVNERGGRPGRVVLRDIFNKHYGDRTAKVFAFEEAENSHYAYVSTKEEAQKLHAEIAWVLENAGFKPIKDEDNLRKNI